KRRVDEGKLKLHGWYFDLESGALMAYSARQQQFLPLVCPLPARGAMSLSAAPDEILKHVGRISVA
ncbi:MAG TPA: hypothetical protein VN089_14315, partial [Duganella sp.]|nr:hypothetical protein [Duganella sp.]